MMRLVSRVAGSGRIPFAVAATVAAAVAIAGCVPRSEVLEGSLPELIERGRASGTAVFDHSDWDRLVRAHARERGRRFDYAGMKREEAALDAYLAALAAAEIPSLSGDELAALFINAYNAYTVKTILDGMTPDGDFEIESIRDIPDVFGVEVHPVGGHTLSLDDMEHRVLRPIFRDPRVHFAVNCASLSCPPLAEHAFTGDGLEEQLEAATLRTLGDADYVRVEDGTVVLTKILDWFGDDFTDPGNRGAEASVAAFAARYSSEARAALDENENAPVRFLHYDWALNRP